MWLSLLTAVGMFGCKAKEVERKRLVSEADVRWYIRATHLAVPTQTEKIFHCDPTTPTATCFLSAAERHEMLANGRITVSDRGFDFLNACQANQTLLQAAYTRKPQFATMLAEIAVGLTGPTGPMLLAARAEFEAAVRSSLLRQGGLMEAIKEAAFKVFPQIAGSLATLDDAELATLSGTLLNLEESDYTAAFVTRFE